MSWLIVLLMSLPAQVEPADESDTMQRWVERYAQSAKEYSILLGGPDGTPLQLHPQSLLNFSNPERSRGQHGSVFVWTHEGRPEAVGTIWSIRNDTAATKRRTTHEFQSLSLAPLHTNHPEVHVLRRNRPLPQWRPESPGIELLDFETPPMPAVSRPGRLVQMRQLARQFNGVCHTRTGGEESLRLLEQPLLRYESPTSDVIDGALFAMVMATDPELLLIIELRDVDGAPRWQYAPARFTGRPLTLRVGKAPVWQCEQAKAWVGNRPYYLCVGVEEIAKP